MAVNGEVVWGDWVSGAGSVGVQMYWDVPTPDTTAISVHWRLWRHAVPGARGDLVGAATVAGSTLTYFNATNHVQPGSGTAIVDVIVATRIFDVPITYGAQVPVDGYGWLHNTAGTDDNGLETDWYLDARPPYAPGAPSGVTATWASDGQINLAWTNTSPTDPAHIYNNVYVERWTAATGWVQIATLGVTSAFADATVSPNNKYAYRVRAANQTGPSAYSAQSAYVSTTPAAATIGTISKSGTSITIPWTNNCPVADSIQVLHSEAGGAYTQIATLAGNATTYTHTGASTTNTHQYRIVTVAGARSSTATSAVVVLQAPPLAPTVTASAAVLDVATTALTIGIVHNPVDSSVQTAGNLRYRKVGTTPWTTVAIGTAASWTLPAGTLTNNASWEVQAQTKGADPNYGPYSASVVVLASTTPQVTMLSPAATVATATLTLTWAYYDAEGTAQAAWRVQITDTATGAVIADQTGTGTATSWTYPSPAPDGAAWTVREWVEDGSGLWSNPAVRAITVDYAEPASPVVTAVFDELTGAVVLTVTAPTPTGGQATTSRHQVQRREPDGSWTQLADVPAVQPGAVSVIDPIPPLNTTVNYRAISTSTIPSSITGAVCALTVPAGRMVYLNAGDGWSTRAKVGGQLNIGGTLGRGKDLVQYEDRPLPVEYADDTRSRVWKVSGKVSAGPLWADELGTWQAWDDMSMQTAPICVRDPMGRKLWCSIGDVDLGNQVGDDYRTPISCTLTEVDYAE